MEISTANTKLDFLSGGGEMGELIRAKNWSKTPLGSPDKWPQSLRTAVSICIASNFPIAIAWGPHRVQIYNDGYWPITGDMHPASMGQDFKECWISAWPVIGQAFEEASLGQTRFLENQRIFLDRYGYKEETFFTFSFSPILDESGGVGGLFHPVIEQTQQTLAERRLNILPAIANQTINARTAEEASALILNCIKNSELDLPFVLFYSIAADSNEAYLAGSVGVEKSSLLAPAKINLKDHALKSWPFNEVIQNGKAVQVEELAEIFGSFNCGPYPEPPKQALVFPILLPGATHNNYFLVAGVSSRRSLDQKYLLFYELLTASVTNVLTKAIAYEEERKKAEALAEIDRAKTVFFANISHEFRTPLTLMLSPLEELLNQKKNNFSESEKQNIETAQRNAMRLLKLVNTLLDFSRIESGRQRAMFSLVDIDTLTKNLASNFRSVIEKAGLKLIIKADSISQPVHLDRQMWEKIVFNLLSNAFKYTLEGKITIELSAEKDFAVLKVKDTGVGIPENELPKMFERFHRVQNVAGRTYEGTGIGLSLVKELVQMHKGTITVESKLKKGSVFTVKIPFVKEHFDSHQISKSDIDSDEISSNIYVEEIETLFETGKKESLNTFSVKDKNILPTILVVDDNADMRKHIRSILSNNFNVVTAKNGMDALHKMKEIIPSLVLSDIMMPVMDGIGLLKEIKSNKTTANIPVIFLTARAGEESRIEGLETGADDYLVKPFSAKELVARVSSNIKTVAIRSSAEKHLYSLLMQMPVAIAIYLGPNFVVELVNDRMLEFYGKPREEIINRPIFEVFPEVAAHGVEELHRKVYETGEGVIANEQRHEYYKNGKLYNGFFNTVFEPLRDLDKNIIGLIVTGHEITEEVTARKKIEESEKQQAFLLKLSDALRPLDNPVDIEKAATKIALDFMEADRCHYSTIEGDNVIILQDASRGDLPTVAGVHPIDSFALYKAALSAGRPFVVDDVRTNNIIDEDLKKMCLQFEYGSFINIPVIKNGKPAGLLSLVQTKPRKWTEVEVQLSIETAERTWAAVQRVKADEALRKSEERLRLATEASDIYWWEFDFNTNTTIYSSNAEHVIGASPSKTMEENLLMLHADDRKIPEQAFEDATKNGTDQFNYMVRSIAVPSEIRWLHVSGRIIRDNQNTPVLAVGISQNFTERKQAEEKIKESESRFRTLADASPVLIWTIDANGLSSYYNKTFRDFIGVSKDEDISDWGKIVHPDDVQSTFDTINTAIAERRSYSLECRLLRSDGHWRWVLAQGNPSIGVSNEFLGFVGSSVDINELKQAEDKIKAKEEQLKNILMHAPAAIAVFEGPQHRYIMVNGEYEKQTSRKAKDLVGKRFNEVFPELEGTGSFELFDNVYRTGETFTAGEYTAMMDLNNEGVARQHYFNFSLEPLKNELKEVYAVVVMSYNITSQVEARKKIEQSEKKFEAAILAVEGIIWTNNAEGEMIGEQPGWANLTGQRFEQYQGYGWANAVHPDDAQPTVDAWKKAVSNRSTFEFEHRVKTKQDGWKLFSIKAVPAFDEKGIIQQWVGVHTDITEQREGVQKIKESEERFHNLIFSSPSAIGILQGEDLIITIGNEPIIEIWGKGKEIIGKKYFEALPELEEQGYKEVFAQVYKTGIPYTAIETPVSILQNGETTLKYYNFILYPQRNINNEVDGIGIIANEVTSQAIFNNKIKESEKQFSTLANNIQNLAWIADGEGWIYWYNQRWYDYTGTTLEEMKGWGWQKVHHPDHVERILEISKKLWTTNAPFELTFPLRRYDGEYRWFLTRGAPISDENGKIISWIGTNTDIEEQKTFSEQLEEKVAERTEQLEQKNIELQKMNKELEAFTYISSHDLQEPLRKIQTFSGRIIASEREQMSENTKDYFKRMNDAATRMQTLINDLLAFSRVSTSERKFEITDLKKIVDEVKEEFKETLEEKKASITTGEMCELNIIPFQFRQLMHNLISNALKFTKPDRVPLIIIKSKIIAVANSPFEDRAACHISVADNGIGFDKQFSERIFGVFQKLHGKDEYAGTGIGLAIVKKIIENHNGIITAESELRKGTTFNIYLPA